MYTGKRAHETPLLAHESDAAALRSENAAIRERLEKLEQALLSSSTPSSSDTRDLSLRHNILPTPSASTPAVAEAEATKGYREDFLWLEGVGHGENTRLPSLSPTFRIRVARIEEIVKNTINGFYHEHDIPLPTLEEAAVFIDVHTTRIDPAQHFTHVPTRKSSSFLVTASLLMTSAPCQIKPTSTEYMRICGMASMLSLIVLSSF